MSVVTAETGYIQVYLVLWLFFYEFMKCIQIEQFIWNYPCSLLPTDTQKWIPYCIARRPLSVCSFVWEHPNTGIDHVSVYWPLSGILYHWHQVCFLSETVEQDRRGAGLLLAVLICHIDCNAPTEVPFQVSLVSNKRTHSHQ